MCEREGSSQESRPRDQAVPATAKPQGSVLSRRVFTGQHSIVTPVTSTHPSATTMSPLHGAKPPKETAMQTEER